MTADPRSPLPPSEMTKTPKPDDGAQHLEGDFSAIADATTRTLETSAAPPSLDALKSTEKSEELGVNQEGSTARTTDAHTTKVAINVCFGGFGLSVAAYEKLIEWGVPVRKYEQQPRNSDTQLYEKVEANEGEIIFDRELTPVGEDGINDIYHQFKGKSRFTERYWDTWTRDSRTHPLVIRVVEELGETANGPCAELKIVEIPAGVEYEIDEYDGREHIAESHRTWS